MHDAAHLRIPRSRGMIRAILACALACAYAAATGSAATSNVVVTMSVPSSTTLTNSCTQRAAWDFGVVQPGTTATTTTSASVCRIDFMSSNDTSMLRLGQSDGVGTAMGTSALTWSEQRHVGGFRDVAAAGPTAAFAGGEFGDVLRTTDGIAWAYIADVPGGDMNRLAAIDSNTLFATRGSSLYKWTGAWGAAIAHGATGTITVGAVRGGTGVWVGGDNGVIRYSNNSGGAWVGQSTGGTGRVSHIVPISGANGWAAADSGGANGTAVYVTGNSGSTWTRTTGDPNTGGFPLDFAAEDMTYAYVVGNNRTLRRTVNGGTNWTNVTPAGAVDLWGVSASRDGSGVVWAYGERGRVYRSGDHGSTWAPVTTPTGNSLTTGDAWDSTHAWMSGAGRVVVQTLDGTAWAEQNETDDGDSWSAVEALSSSNAWVAGADGNVRRTTDGGSTWALQSIGTTTPLWGISATSTTRAAVVGRGGLLRTTTDGTNWSAQASGTSVDLRSIDHGDDDRMWAVGDGGTIIRSTNGGTSWSPQASGTASDLLSVSAVDDQVAWAAGENGTVLRTTNGGTTWTSVPALAGVRHDAISAVNAQVAWLVGRVAPGVAGQSDYVWVTTNGGTSWSLKPAPGLAGAHGLSAVNEDIAYISELMWTKVVRTVDAGATWSTVSLPWNHAIAAIDAVDANTVWGAGYDSYIAKGTPPTSITDFATGVQDWVVGTQHFGVCVQDVALSATVAAPWVEDTTTTPGQCTASNADPWAAVPAASTKVASTASAGQSGRVDFVWGVRIPSSQAKGTYTAGVRFEVIAPAV